MKLFGMLLCDGYKLDHPRQYPENTTAVCSNWTPRESRIPGVDHVVHFGLQYFLQEYLGPNGVFDRTFFHRPEDEVCARFASRVNSYLGPNDIGVEHIRALHRNRYMPLVFRALPEGTRVPLRVPMFTVENTLPAFGWLTNSIESLASSVLWLPSTSATQAHRLRILLNQKAALTGTSCEAVQWQGHDFSFRGMPGPEAAAMSGAGHLLSFTGTDTIPALDFVDEYYGGGLPRGYLVGGSVAATEHSVMCAGGNDGELQTFERLLDLYPSGIFSVVSDTWDLWKVLTVILPALKDRIIARDGKVVIRPDSGDPVDIICGDPNADEGSPARLGVVELLWNLFGGTTTRTGHRMLDSHIGCIYGDSITYDRAEQIADRLAAKGFASGNVVFGIGSYTYQYVTRDTFGFAMKATWAEIDGKGVDMFKAPVTGNGVKASAIGRLAVLNGANGLTLVSRATPAQEAQSLLEPTWVNGRFVRRYNFQQIRERLWGLPA